MGCRGVRITLSRSLAVSHSTRAAALSLSRLGFDDTPAALFEKIHNEPKGRDDTGTESYAKWALADFGLHVQYCLVNNWIHCVRITSPHY